MICPACQAASHVLDSRPVKNKLRRRRECLACQYRWTTYEMGPGKHENEESFIIPFSQHQDLVQQLQAMQQAITKLQTILNAGTNLERKEQP